MGGDDEQVIVSSPLTVAAAIGADVKLLDDMAHALAEEPGHRAAPQTEVAKSGSTQSRPSGSAST